MKIRKKEQSFGILGKIINSMSQSKNDTYSCDYINNLEAGDALPIGTIVDYDGDTVPDGYEEISDYSTDEIEIGTWIDGNTLYRKCYTGKLGTDITELTSEINTNTNILINAYGFIGDALRGINLGHYVNDKWYCGLYSNDKGIQIYHGNGTNGLNYYIVLEYTKQ